MCDYQVDLLLTLEEFCGEEGVFEGTGEQCGLFSAVFAKASSFRKCLLPRKILAWQHNWQQEGSIALPGWELRCAGMHNADEAGHVWQDVAHSPAAHRDFHSCETRNCALL